MDEVYEKKQSKPRDHEDHDEHHADHRQDHHRPSDESPVSHKRKNSTIEIDESNKSNDGYGDSLVEGILKQNMGAYSSHSSQTISREELIQKKMEELKELGMSSNEVLAKFKLLL